MFWYTFCSLNQTFGYSHAGDMFNTYRNANERHVIQFDGWSVVAIWGFDRFSGFLIKDMGKVVDMLADL